jgi:hypothetical protein
MRKTLLERDPAQPGFQSDRDWLDVEKLATVQVTWCWHMSGGEYCTSTSRLIRLRNGLPSNFAMRSPGTRHPAICCETGIESSATTSPTGPRHGHRASALCAALPVAQSLHRARDWNLSARMSRSCDHLQRSGAVPPHKNIHGILSRGENTSLIGQGFAGAAGDAAARTRTSRGYSASGRPPSPLRATRSLKTVGTLFVRTEEVCHQGRFSRSLVTNRQ